MSPPGDDSAWCRERRGERAVVRTPSGEIAGNHQKVLVDSGYTMVTKYLNFNHFKPEMYEFLGPTNYLVLHEDLVYSVTNSYSNFKLIAIVFVEFFS